MMKRILMLFSLFVLIAGCNVNSNSTSKTSIPEQAFNNLAKEEKLLVERATPVQLIELFEKGINEKNPNLAVAVFTPEFLSSSSLVEAQKLFEGFSIKVLEVIHDAEKNTTENTENKYHIIMTFEVTIKSENTKWAAGPGEHTRYVQFTKVNDLWKINNMATSP